MKVIVAGFSKTGTKTMNAALSELGYNVYDFMEHFWYHEKNWKKIFKEGGDIEDFKNMYEDVDAVVDAPAFLFWEEIADAFPESKIIFTTRDEDIWAESLRKQFVSPQLTFLRLFVVIFCPVYWRFSNFFRNIMPYLIGHEIPSYGKRLNPNKMLLRKRFREHNNYFLQNAPMDRALIFSVKQGWDPLCKFLGKEIPKKSFPWLNKDGGAIESIIQKHPFQKQLEKECFIVCSLLACLTATILYVIFF